MTEIKQEYLEQAKSIIKKSIKNRDVTKILSDKVKKNNMLMKDYEERIIELMEELGLNNLNINDKKSGKNFNIMIDKKIKKETLSKKKIYENCLIFCKGDEEKTKTIIDHLYSTEHRENIVQEKVVYKPLKE